MVSPVTTGDGGPMKVWASALSEENSELLIMDEVVTQICQGLTLYRIAKHHRWPVAQLKRWIESDPERTKFYNDALEIGAEYYAEKAIGCADDAVKENYQVQRMKSDVYQWMASKLNRRKFGDDKNTGNVNLNVPITIVHQSR